MVPLLLDTTLRDGEQTPGLYFTLEQKLQLAQRLDALGIPILEAGIPTMGVSEVEFFKELSGLKLKSTILGWCRLSHEDLDWALKAQLEHIHISAPSSSVLLEAKLHKSRDQVIQEMTALVKDSLRLGFTVSVGAEDSSRSRPEDLRAFYGAAIDAGAHRVRFADTLGLMTPYKVMETIKPLTQFLGDIPLDYHGHNDFGLAAANSLSAWRAGARVLSCTLLGLGERAGNTPLEEIGAILQLLEGVDLGLDFVALGELCTFIASLTGWGLPDHKPFYGANVFTHESGIHVDGLLKDSRTYEALSPSIFGRSRRLVLGKHSGRAGVRYFAREKADLSDSEIIQFLAHLRSLMSREIGVKALEELEKWMLKREGDHANTDTP